VTFLATLSGPIDLFYGTETGLANGSPKTGFVDAGRVPMPWKNLNEDLMGQVRKALETRRAHPALSRGGRIPLLADRDQLVMAKVAPGETILVGVNLANEPKDITVDLAGLLAPGATTLQPLVGNSPASVGETGQLKWHLPALSTVLVSVPAR
jgi:glycosidase